MPNLESFLLPTRYKQRLQLFTGDVKACAICQSVDMEQLRYFVEKQAFGVCTRLGERMNISASSIRLYFIYTSFLTLGSPVVIYLVLAFWLELRTHLRRRNHPTVWDL
jgi:phage shock protein C